MVDIIHRVGIKAPIAMVYAAVSTIEGIAGWWTEETTGVSEPGGSIEVLFSSPSGERMGGMRMEVMALAPDSKVHWRFRSGPEEWLGTDAIPARAGRRLHHRPLRSQELARGGGVHRALQHEVGDVPAEPQGARRNG